MNEPPIQPRPWAPFLVALGFVLNVAVLGTWLDVGVLLAATGILSVGAGVLLLAGRLLLRDLTRAVLIATLAMVWFCSFGAFHDTLVGLEGKILPFTSVRMRYTLAGSFMALTAAALFVGRTRRTLVRLHRVMNLAGLFLVLSAFPGLIRRSLAFSALPSSAPAAQRIASSDRPDVFFIVLDSYTSSESLLKHWGFDNSPFESELRKRGLQVLPEARSNYRSTPATIGSMFLMNYLQRVDGPDPGLYENDPDGLTHLIQAGRVPAIFKSLGYKIINLSLFDVGTTRRHYTFIFENNYSIAGFLRHTAWFRFAVARANMGLWKEIADINLGIFDALAKTPPSAPGEPAFVYAHVMMPHPPFSFDHTGRRLGNHLPLDLNERQAAYLEQLRYVNGLVLATLDRILARSAKRPVIILQGDHGYRFIAEPIGTEECFTILNAVSLPDGVAVPIPPGLTPVNTFRFIFNACFGTSYPLLEDRVIRDTGQAVWRPLRKVL